jgi:hypothetical protein
MRVDVGDREKEAEAASVAPPHPQLRMTDVGCTRVILCGNEVRAGVGTVFAKESGVGQAVVLSKPVEAATPCLVTI